jgi:hypothetical protein
MAKLTPTTIEAAAAELILAIAERLTSTANPTCANLPGA